jgi:hypothetical protein
MLDRIDLDVDFLKKGAHIEVLWDQ